MFLFGRICQMRAEEPRGGACDAIRQQDLPFIFGTMSYVRKYANKSEVLFHLYYDVH